ncbi:hypothetical protein C7999DRAFT_14377 [Corynascus novoguineensis]|uniref:Rab-GAP TBC domain-containing protein n=1 Tax=Corynascus novoguineensis TaxID=1126955 RepID=A0AAN7CTE0_9PEZI|nr:hypothetical protein C7999DRAFT_14377 [Corynascus novoguineensis]
MMIYESPLNDAVLPGPGSPPGMTASKSSKSSSLSSLPSDDESVVADVAHFEDIGLDDGQLDPRAVSDKHLKNAPNPYSPSFSSDLRAVTRRPASASTPRLQFSRDSSRTRQNRDVAPSVRSRPALALQSQIRTTNGRVTSLGLVPEPSTGPLPFRTLGRQPSQTSLSSRRSPSPNLSLSPKDPNLRMRPRRSSWQSNRERKTALELEMECDEDDGDDIPDGLVLDNVPISPRPPSERSQSRPPSKAPSPERPPKERVRSVGNGTPAVAVAQGSLRSPTWKSESALSTMSSAASSRVSSPVATRTKSWSAALAELNAEAKALTEKLEEHAEKMEHKMQQRSSTGSMPNTRRSSDPEVKPRVKSAMAELPPLRRPNIMIDPLPISKEKEAVLSRTRPSWLPPKDPAEERRHLKEYQKMMAQSLEADRRRQAAKRARSECRDVAADSIMQIWEHDIIPRWNEAIRERRTRDMWWRGIAPRSRGAVWTRAIGNELGLTKTSFEAALSRAREAETRAKSGHGSVEDMRAVAWFNAISEDVRERTWPDLRIFQPSGPLHQSLIDVLRAYAMYRSDIGYVPGCNTIAALLLLNLPTPTDSFIALANVLNRPLPLSFYASDAGAKNSAYNLVLHTLLSKSPSLHEHLIKLAGADRDRDPEAYLETVFTGLFTRHLALDEVTRLWDVYVFEGDALLVRAAVALLLQREMALLATGSVPEVQTVLLGGSVEVVPAAGAASDAALNPTSPSPDGSSATVSPSSSTGGARLSVLSPPPKSPRVVGAQGDEDRWMKAVRDAGKA